MGWAVGYDSTWRRDIGYGVPAFCDEPGCEKVIDRGLAYVCCDALPYGGDRGCGLYFCEQHRKTRVSGDEAKSVCAHEGEYLAKPDHPDWIRHKLSHPSWAAWRKEHRAEVILLRAGLDLVRGGTDAA